MDCKRGKGAKWPGGLQPGAAKEQKHQESSSKILMGPIGGL
jgi:hypothetical protein